GPDGTGGISLGAPEFGLRFLQLFYANSNSVRLLSVAGRLLQHPSAKIRSKAAVMIGKLSRQYEWIEQTRHEKDDRVRANALEALWEPGIPPRLRKLLWNSVNDPSNRVAGNALLGLYRQGDAGCIPLIGAMTKHADERFRATAAWVIGETGDERFRDYVMPLLTSTSLLVRQNAEDALAKLNKQANFASIEKIQLILFPDGDDRVVPSAGTPLPPRANANVQPAITPTHSVRAGVISAQNRPVSALLPTDFLITHNSAIVEHYAVQTEPVPDAMSIAFAIPAGASQSMLPKWRLFFSQFSKQKRHLDYWAPIEYGTVAASGIPAAARAPAKLTYCRSSLELEEYFKAHSLSKFSVPFERVVESALEAPPHARTRAATPQHALHAVLIEPVDLTPLPAETLATFQKIATRVGVRVHVLSPRPDSTLRELAATTGGAFLSCASDIESCQRALLVLYAALFATYRVEIDCGEAGEHAAEIRIEVRRGPLRGEIRTS